ncbi:MAG: sigma-70 family RNA polymerase sigma factor [Prevotella sp.]|nr:sigma-70 family RNA polymerase sigma factor [Prevotella sp.]
MDKQYEREFENFIKKNEQRAFNTLSKHYSVLSEDDIKNIIYESYAVLHKNIVDKKVDSPQYPYFLKICYNLSLKAIRNQGKHPVVGINDTDIQQPNTVSMTKVESILQVCQEQESVINEKKQLVHDALGEMATRCRELLWSFYADELSWATIAEQCGLKNADTAKAAASRCRQTFKEKYNHLRLRFYGK